jgi:16S rRNA (uracil1498-N3)-methyltransferase
MELFYIPQLKEIGCEVEISGAEARHIARVLRHKAGDEVLGTNGAGEEFRLVLKKVAPERVVAQVLEKRLRSREPNHRLVLAQAVLKGDKLAEVVESVTELGVDEVIPFICERVVGKLTESKYRRLEGVAVSAMKSSTRTVLPRIGRLIDFDDLREVFSDFDQVIVAYEEERKTALAKVLNRNVNKIMLVIGPEGGFTPKEIEKMSDAGAVCCSLGPRRLRAETAAITAVSIVLGLLGDLG